jgi:hypothetical protein
MSFLIDLSSFQVDLESYYIPISQKIFIEHDQTIANNIESTSFQLMLHNFMSSSQLFGSKIHTKAPTKIRFFGWHIVLI